MRLPLLALLLLTVAPANSEAQWQLQDAHTSADLRGIDNVGGGVAWASGTNGTVLRTEDAGFVWQLCAIPPNAEHLDFRAIQAFDNNTAIVMSSGKGDLSRLYKTTDGCQTWTLLFTNPDKDGFWDALIAHPEGTYYGSPLSIDGVLLGDPTLNQFTYLTFEDSYAASNQGKLLHRLSLERQKDPSLQADPAEAGAFAASNQSLAVPPTPTEASLKERRRPIWPFGIAFVTGGKGGARLFTSKPPEGDQVGATKWTSTQIPVGANTEASGAFAIALTSAPQSGVIVGGDYQHPTEAEHTAVFYNASQKRWTAAQTPPHGYRSAVAYDPTHNTWITVGPNGTDISTDDGRNWRPLKPNPKFNDPPDADQHWNALSLPYAVGPHGRIAALRPEALPAHGSSPQ